MMTNSWGTKGTYFAISKHPESAACDTKVAWCWEISDGKQLPWSLSGGFETYYDIRGNLDFPMATGGLEQFQGFP